MAVVTCTRRAEVAGRRVLGACTDEDRTDVVHVIEYEGAVLATREMNGYDDSDFYATVYDAEANEVREVMYATTRGWTYHNGAAVDADEATIEAAIASRESRIRETVRASMEAEAAELARGSRVEFTRAFNGRTQATVAKGATGRIFWTGPCRFNAHVTRAGVNLDDGETVWVNQNMLAATEAAEVDEADFEAAVARGLANLRHRYTRQARAVAA